MRRWWSARTCAYASPSCWSIAVEPSMSVNRKVSVCVANAAPSVCCLWAGQPEQLGADAHDRGRGIAGYRRLEYHVVGFLALLDQGARDPDDISAGGPDNYVRVGRRYHCGRHRKTNRNKVARWRRGDRVCMWHSSGSGIRKVAASFVG